MIYLENIYNILLHILYIQLLLLKFLSGITLKAIKSIVNFLILWYHKKSFFNFLDTTALRKMLILR